MQTAIIGGVARHLGAWRPSPLKLRGIRPTIDASQLPIEHTIEGVPTDYDQGQLGSCASNSLAEIYEVNLKAKFSRLFSYFFTRATEGDFLDDTGVTISDLLSVAATMGMPREELWPYEIAKYQTPPPLSTLVEAVRHRVERWDPITDLDHLLCEITYGQPVILGFQVPASMQDGSGDTATTGRVRVPSATDPSIGGHCVVAYGFNRSRREIKATCHYGRNFGDGGSIWLPFSMFTSGNAMDLAAVRRIS